jgi:hypothetical protein
MPARAERLFIQRVMPLLMFLAYILFCKTIINFRHLKNILRIVLITSIIIYILPDYDTQTALLLTKYNILKESKSTGIIFFMDGLRNQGYTYDPRIWGMVSYLFLLVTLMLDKQKYPVFDIILSIVVCLSTLSRAPIGVMGLLIFVYFLKNINIKLIVILVFLIMFGIFILNRMESLDWAHDYVATFNIFSKKPTNVLGQVNAFDQRSFGRDFAMEQFSRKPFFGIGFGLLKAVDHPQISKYGGVVTDAYIYVLLAEIGIIGFIHFMLSFLELFFRKNIYVLAFSMGLLISFVGTDIPDMGFIYFLLLAVSTSLFSKNEIKICKKQHTRSKLFKIAVSV